MKKTITILLAVLLPFTGMAQEDRTRALDAINEEAVRGPLEFLASDWTEGREMGSRGEYMSADYIASIFKMYGIKPMGDMAEKPRTREEGLRSGKREREKYRTYFQNFDLISEPRNMEKTLFLTRKNGPSSESFRLMYNVDFRLNNHNLPVLDINSQVVFLGYGITSDELRCDAFKNVDLRGKIAFILSGYPGMNDKNSSNYQKFNTAYRSRNYERGKIEKAREMGAAAVVLYRPNGTFTSRPPYDLPVFSDQEFYEGDKPHKDFYSKYLYLPAHQSTDIPVIEVSGKQAGRMFSDNGEELRSLTGDCDLSRFRSRDLDCFLHLKVEGEQKLLRARNVLGYIEGEDKTEAIVIAGHYDHVGKYDNFIFNGADDNASGTVGVISLARAFKASGKKPKKTIIFAAWTGEEQGLWGSKYFVDHIPDGIKVILNVNMDMIGRTTIQKDSRNYLEVQYTDRFPEYEQLLKKYNSEFGYRLDLEFRADQQPKGASDFDSFSKKDIPVMAFFTGLHEHYHYPNDEVHYIDFEKMTRILRLIYLTTDDIINK